MQRLQSAAIAVVIGMLVVHGEVSASETRAVATPPGNGAALPSDSDPFQMTADDTFKIATGRVIVTGQVTSGRVSKGDSVCLPSGRSVEILGIEQFNRVIDSAAVGDRVGLLLADVSVADVNPGAELNADCVQ